MGIKNYDAITSLDELASLIDEVHGSVFAFDIETGYHGPDREKGSLHPETAIVVGISFTNSKDWARYVPLAHDRGENVDNYQAARLFWKLLATGHGVAHNVPFELRHLAKWFRELLSDDPDYGADVRASRGYYPVRSDTQVEAYLTAESRKFGLKPLTKELFGHVMTELHELFQDLAVNKRKFLRFNTLELDPKVIAYACEDSVWCLALHERYYEALKNTLLYRVEMATVQHVTPPMEDEGIVYDWALMRRTADKLRLFRDKFNAEIMAELTELCNEPIAISLASAPAISRVLFDKLGYRTNVYTDKTRDLPPDQRKMSTGKIALERLAQQHPVVQKIRQWKQMTRLLGTYLDAYETKFNYAEDGRAHPNHLSAFVITGRFAHSDPPYAQSPKKYHYDLKEATRAHELGEEPPPGTCFTFNFRDVIMAPPEHYILGFDLGQAELRAIAGEAQETALLEAFANGDDVHRITAALMLGISLDDVTKDQRDVGKTMNFALLYGMSTKGLADRLGIPIEEAQSLMDKYFSGMSNIAAYMSKQIEHGRNHGYVTSKFLRKLPIWEYQDERRFMQQKGDRACVNYPIQGAATGDYMKIAMVRAVAAIKEAGLTDKIKLVMNIHDALEFYVHRSITPERAVKVLRDAVVFPVPGWPAMQADWHVAKRWGSPTEITVNDDGTITVKGDKVFDLIPEIIEDEDGEPVEVLPTVPVEVLHEAAVAARRTVLLTLLNMPTHDQWTQFLQLLYTLPGNDLLNVRTPSGKINVQLPTSLSLSHLGQVAQLLPGASMAYETTASSDALMEGLTL